MSAIGPLSPTDPATGELVTEQTEFDLLFPQIPVEDDPTPPDEDSLRLVDDLQDMAGDERVDDADAAEVTLGFDVVYDWDTHELYSGGPQGDVLLMDGDDAAIEWALKMLNIEPNTYAIYPPGLGAGVQDLLAQGLPGPTLFSLITQRVEEKLAIPPIVSAAVSNLRFEPSYERDALLGTITLELDTDPTPISFEVSF